MFNGFQKKLYQTDKLKKKLKFTCDCLLVEKGRVYRVSRFDDFKKGNMSG